MEPIYPAPPVTRIFGTHPDYSGDGANLLFTTGYAILDRFNLWQLGGNCYNQDFQVMDIPKMIAELRSEQAAIEDAVAVLERLAKTRGKRRGRPPSWMTAMRGAAAEQDGEPRTRVL